MRGLLVLVQVAALVGIGFVLLRFIVPTYSSVAALELDPPAASRASAPASAPAASQAADGMTWRPLFNGVDLTGWECQAGAWTVGDGALCCTPGRGFLWTREEFDNFHLQLEFKVPPGGNSGVFVRTGSVEDWLHTGIEVQILDSHGKAEVGKHDCGAIYDCLAPSRNAARPAGEWNSLEIICRDANIQVILNREPVIDMDLNEWTTPGRNPDGTPNKFRTAYRDMPRRGRIGFQDHGASVCFRNIRLRTYTGD